ncbi:MAG: hypothetical protein V8Q42_01845 [Anaerovoracaceae bacterium]
MRKLKLKKKDIAVMITMPVLTVAFLLMAGCSGGNTAIEGYQATLSITAAVAYRSHGAVMRSTTA